MMENPTWFHPCSLWPLGFDASFGKSRSHTLSHYGRGCGYARLVKWSVMSLGVCKIIEDTCIKMQSFNLVYMQLKIQQPLHKKGLGFRGAPYIGIGPRSVTSTTQPASSTASCTCGRESGRAIHLATLLCRREGFFFYKYDKSVTPSLSICTNFFTPALKSLKVLQADSRAKLVHMIENKSSKYSDR